METESKLTFIVTCKGRLDHLRITVPRLMAQTNCQTIVVDSNCPNGAGSWVSANYPNAKVIMLDDHGQFNLAKCRNAGLQLSQTEWVCFVDADIVISARFSSFMMPLLKRGTYCVFNTSDRRTGLTGTCIVSRNDAISIEGYDDVFEAWGGEDRDFYRRLEMIGVEAIHLPDHLVEEVIRHSAAKRTEFCENKNLTLSFAVAALYSRAKFSAMKLNDNKPLDLAERRGLHALAQQTVDRAVASGDKKSMLTYDIPENSGTLFFGVKVRQKVLLELDLTKATGQSG